MLYVSRNELVWEQRKYASFIVNSESRTEACVDEMFAELVTQLMSSTP